MEKLITFVVPSYNSQDYLHICVDSLLKGGKDVEILIVNDGSTDRTREIGEKYERENPGIVRLLNQENGGHGEGINHGLREARGKYFKVVDSDDWVDEKALHAVIKRLKYWEKKGCEPDLLLTNYVYVNKEKDKTRVIRFTGTLPRNKVIGWEDTRYFHLWQNLTLHTCIFKTRIIRRSGVILPKHIFYEDNYFVYVPIALVETLAYLNVDFYQYLIGRAGQSVEEETLKKRCYHQVMISKLCFVTHDIGVQIKKNKKRGKCLYHQLELMMCLASIFPRLNADEEHDKMVRDMWAFCFRNNFFLALRIRFFSYVFMLNLPGKPGRFISKTLYRISNLMVPFN